MTTNWKCSEDPNDITHELTGQISKNPNILQLCRWANGKVGAIFPIKDSQTLCFSKVKAGNRNDPELVLNPLQEMPTNNSDIDSSIISCEGIVAHWLLDSCGLHPTKTGFEILNDTNFRKNILYALKERPHLEPLYEKHLEVALTTARKLFESQQDEIRTQPGSWKPENKREFKFSLENHLKEERRMLQYDERHLYSFFRQEDIEFMRDIAKDYQEYIQSKLDNSSISQTEEENITKGKKPNEEEPFVPTQDTFEIKNTTVERLKLIFQFCIDRKWLNALTRVEDWLKLFTGVPSDVCMVWDYDARHALRDLFWMMDRECDAEEKTFLKPRKNYLQIVSSHFVSVKPSKENPHPYITEFNGRNNQQQYKQIIEYCRRILKGEDIDIIIYEMLQAQEESKDQKNKSIIEETMPDNIKIDEDNAALQRGQRTPRKPIRQTNIK